MSGWPIWAWRAVFVSLWENCRPCWSCLSQCLVLAELKCSTSRVIVSLYTFVCATIHSTLHSFLMATLSDSAVHTQVSHPHNLHGKKKIQFKQLIRLLILSQDAVVALLDILWIAQFALISVTNHEIHPAHCYIVSSGHYYYYYY